jgi:ABC-type spermidine/putrescine transport system permease subunit II
MEPVPADQCPSSQKEGGMDLWEMFGVSRQVGLALIAAGVVLTIVAGFVVRRRAQTERRTVVDLSDRG